MKIILAVCCFLFSNIGSAQYLWQIKKDTVVKWHYFDGDEFDGPVVDSLKWIPAYSWTRLNYDFDYLMTPARLEFEQGICRFMCYRDTGLYTVPGWQLDSAFAKKHRGSLVDGNKFRYLFTAGNVWSRMQYGKGYFEIRFKTTDAYGMWPAFWLYGSNKDEIDFFELKGERNNQVHIDVHCLKGCEHGYRGGSFLPKAFGGWIKTTKPLAEGYNVLAGEWEDGYVKWYLNGEGIGYYKGEFGSDKMNLIIGTGPAKNGLGFAPGVTGSSAFPNSLDVDYVRVWYKTKASKADIPGKKHRLFTYAKTENPAPAFLKKKIGFMYDKKAFKGDFLTVSLLPSGKNKYILSSQGKTIDYHLSIYDQQGNEIIKKHILSSLYELDLSTHPNPAPYKVKIVTAFKTVEEIIQAE
jgi:beta-glucanase (GH16 family)